MYNTSMILDTINDRCTGSNCGESIRRSLVAITNYALGRAYWKRMLEARRNGDTTAEEYWGKHALLSMSPADKRREGIR